MKTKTYLPKHLLNFSLLALFVATSACGTRKINSMTTELSSRVTQEGSTGEVDDSLAQCNQVQGDDLTATIKIYQDPYTRQVRNDFLRLKINNLKSEYFSSSYKIRFFRWKANQQEVTSLDKNPLQVKIEKSDSVNLSGWSSDFSPTNFLNLVRQSGQDAEDAEAALNKHQLVIDLKDPEADYDALKIVVYQQDSSSSASQPKAIHSVDLLIPLFYAHPVRYSSDKPKVLIDLHPFTGQEQSGWDGSHYADELNQSCF